MSVQTHFEAFLSGDESRPAMCAHSCAGDLKTARAAIDERNAAFFSDKPRGHYIVRVTREIVENVKR